MSAAGSVVLKGFMPSGSDGHQPTRLVRLRRTSALLGHGTSILFRSSTQGRCAALVLCFSPLPLLRPRPPSLPPSLSATSDFCRTMLAAVRVVPSKQNKTKRSRLTRPTGQATRTALSPPWPPPSRRSSADPNARATTTTAAAAAEERRRHSVT